MNFLDITSKLGLNRIKRYKQNIKHVRIVDEFFGSFYIAVRVDVHDISDSGDMSNGLLYLSPTLQLLYCPYKYSSMEECVKHIKKAGLTKYFTN